MSKDYSHLYFYKDVYRGLCVEKVVPPFKVNQVLLHFTLLLKRHDTNSKDYSHLYFYKDVYRGLCVEKEVTPFKVN
jgi:hypothetical protein